MINISKPTSSTSSLVVVTQVDIQPATSSKKDENPQELNVPNNLNNPNGDNNPNDDNNLNHDILTQN